ncbi:MAG TPA: FtsQ-type POTRA domain-containing protein [Mycobacteriales bacterium]|nr:FtsQ-type POTRA domain-containing protein [Mycobacteriales bacterium]
MSGATRVAPAPAGSLRGAGSGRRRVLVLAAVVLLVLATAVWVVGFTGVLGVRTVAVGGARALPAESVRQAAAVPEGEPLARVDTDAVAERVRRIPGVARVAVARSWPSTLKITVTERRGVAVVARGGAAWLVDGEGVVFQRLAGRPKGLPRLDVPCTAPDEPPCGAALSALTALPPPVAAQVLAVTAPTPDSVTLSLTGGRTVLWGGADEPAAKAQVLAALLRRPGQRYDVSTPTVVTVR